MEEANKVAVKGNGDILTIPTTRELVIISGLKGSRDCSAGSNSEGKKSSCKNFDLHYGPKNNDTTEDTIEHFIYPLGPSKSGAFYMKLVA